MRYTDERAENLFARLLTYSPRSDKREELENYCTEALAWCIIKSDLFADSLLKEIRTIADVKPQVAGLRGRLRVDTQIGFTGDDLLQSREEGITPRGGRFDLLLSPKDDNGFLIAIEIKTTLDRSLAAQVDDYVRALREPQVRSKYRDFSESYVVTLTPARKEKTNAHGHLSWGDIRRLIQGCRDRAIASELRGFAEFLELRHLSPVDMPPLTSDLMEHFAQAAPFLAKAKRLFERFENESCLRKFFRRASFERPLVDHDEDTNTTWYGIWDNRDGRFAYAGFSIKNGFAGLYAEVELRREKSQVLAKLDPATKADYEEAIRLKFKTASTSETDKKRIWLAHPIRQHDTPADYERWFVNTFSELERVAG
jgi:hypothetical protein